MENTKLNSKKSWMVAIVVFICFFVIETSEQRVPPVMGIICSDMGIDVTQAGWLMSAIGWGSLISALPAAWILTKLRPKLTMALAVLCPLIAGVIGAIPDTFAMLMVARAFSGVGIGILGVISAFIIDEWFTPDKRGLPTAILISTYPMACFFMLNSSPVVESIAGWHGVWTIGAVLCAITLVLVLAFLPNERPYSETYAAELAAADEAAKSEKVSVAKLLSCRSLWCVLLAFLAFDITFYGLTSYMPTTLTEVYGADLAQADFAVSLLSAIMIPATWLNGVLLNKVGIKNRKFMPAVGLAGLAIFCMSAFHAPDLLIATIAVVGAGFFCGFISSSLFTIGPDCIPRPAYLGIIVALVTAFQNAGIAVGPVTIGMIVDSAGVWSAAGLPCLIVGLTGAACCLLINNKEAHELAEKEARELAEMKAQE